MEFKGTIIHALEPRSFNSKKDGTPFAIQEFVIENNETQYPRKLVFSVFGSDRLKEMNIQVGEYVNVKFDVDAREYNGKWYNDIRAWRVERPAQMQQSAPQLQFIPQQPQQQSIPPQQVAMQIPSPAAPIAPGKEDLPF